MVRICMFSGCGHCARCVVCGVWGGRTCLCAFVVSVHERTRACLACFGERYNYQLLLLLLLLLLLRLLLKLSL